MSDAARAVAFLRRRKAKLKLPDVPVGGEDGDDVVDVLSGQVDAGVPQVLVDDAELDKALLGGDGVVLAVGDGCDAAVFGGNEALICSFFFGLLAMNFGSFSELFHFGS